jgi:ATP-dependent RNA helicase DeaD
METIQFQDLPLSEEILAALAGAEFTTATPIQAQSIPLLLQGNDLIGLAQTGSGKTLAFGLPALEQIDVNLRKTQVMIICPTRELAQQVNNVLKDFAKAIGNVYTTTLVGGESMQYQIRDLARGSHIVVGTAGRIIDHLERGTLQPENIHYVVLDEADEMLNMGFQEDIEKILQYLPEERQTALFSATMPPAIRKLCNKYLTDPQTVEIAKTAQTAPKIEQLYFYVKPDLKTEAIVRLIEYHDISRGMVFCNTKLMVDNLVEQLQIKGITAEGLHGDMAQWQRTSVMNRFRTGVLNILVATDVAARGIDVDDVEAVFNYDVPQDIDFYVHRIGRTARAGKKGMSFTLVYGKDIRQLREIEHITKDKIVKSNVPILKEIQEKRNARLVNKIQHEMANDEHLEHYGALAAQILASSISPEQVIAAMLKMQLGVTAGQRDVFEEELLKEQQMRNRGDREGRFGDRESRFSSRDGVFNRRDGGRTTGGDRKKGFAYDPNISYRKLQLNVGHNAKVQARDIVGAFTGEANIKKSDIGKVDVFDKHSFVEVADKHVERVMRAMHNNTIKGKKIHLEFV